MDEVQNQAVDKVAVEQAVSKTLASKQIRSAIHRVNLRDFLLKQDGKFTTVDFLKKDGSCRVLNGRLGVVKHLKGGTNNTEATHNPYLTVFDVKCGGYRTVNLATVTRIRAQNAEFLVHG